MGEELSAGQTPWFSAHGRRQRDGGKNPEAAYALAQESQTGTADGVFDIWGAKDPLAAAAEAAHLPIGKT